MITIIAAKSSNGVIGLDNKLPWNLPEDLKRFQKLTTGNTIVMGRKTFESIGRPLKNRNNVVITRDNNWKYDNVTVINDINDILLLKGNIFIIGGSEIYDQTMNIADTLEITKIDKEFIGDSFFPEIYSHTWRVENEEIHENQDFSYSYITYKKNIL